MYNRVLAWRTQAWFEEKKRVGYNESSRALTEWKRDPDLSFLSEVSSVPLQQSLRNLQTAYTSFFAKRARYPSFKKKGRGGTAKFVGESFRWRNGQLWLAKLKDPIKIVWSRPLPRASRPTTITVSLDPAGRWHVSFLIDQTIRKLRRSKKALGLDLGITTLVTTSEGEKVRNPKCLARDLERIRRRSKVVSRKQKGSKNKERALRKLSRAHAEISDKRRDYLHKLTTRLVRENQTIVVEDLAVRNMMQNRHLSRSIADASWSELVRQLDYKCEWYGRELIEIDRFFPSSKRCFSCGYILSELLLEVRVWDCPRCNSRHDRDVNAAKNILAAGLAVSACGDGVRLSSH